MPTKPFNFRLPVGLVEAVDSYRGDIPRTRFVVRALEKALPVGYVGPEATQGEDLSSSGGRERAAPDLSPASPRASLPGRDALAETLAKLPNSRVGPRRPRVGPRPRGKR